MRAGLAAEFTRADALEHAAAELVRRGYRELDAFTPRALPELDEILGLRRSLLDWAVAPFAFAAAGGAFWLQAWCNAVDYPLNVGGRPELATPAFIPITFELGVLATGLSSLLLLLWRIGLPRLAHPLFAVDGFERATVDRYWLAIDASDPYLDARRSAEELLALGAERVVPFGGEP
jgi:hypothetical protein